MTTFPAWDDGTTTSGPEHQVHWYDDRTAIIRQALRTNFEGPFCYLLLGSERALLLDTGTGHADLRAVVDELLSGHELELVVAHTHGHGDHIGGDAQFDHVVGTSAEEVAEYFGITAWPDQIVQFELGERTLDIIPIPGHHTTDLAFYDRSTRLLLTGDSLYPGRLYVTDWAAYRASVARLAEFVATGNPVELVLGAHIEMTDQAGADFAMGADRHPGEHELALRSAVLAELAAVLAEAGPEPRRVVREHFIVFPR
ncbi:MBL fold metallo-hydrolase [Kribbella sp. CA-293567]|uniref:MBL fold metallo-hydrolase n=1 Tax=Kribbella sp. CA-293567 TaxID=3002436 RepID=UPI0022DD666E|nr:MBL fold metallo-hydrolase [Kribbella sp. CA-293567]WBQ02044.1 MBL fold metallo-hydrolase [Kribbella sp. CA-293567]